MAKFGINSKAVEGRERKKAAADAKDQVKRAELEAKEAEAWKAGAKSVDKKAAEEAKRLEKLAKKKEREALEEEEMSSIKTVPAIKSEKPAMSKKTQFELLMRPSPVYSKKSSSNLSTNSLLDLPTEPLNRPGSAVSGGRSDSVSEYSASNLDDAIQLLEAANLDTSKTNLERHPERRVKAAYAVFEETEMPILKLENPGLRLSQLRQLLKKMWEKSPQNPFNQASISYRASRDEELEAVKSMRDTQLDRFKN